MPCVKEDYSFIQKLSNVIARRDESRLSGGGGSLDWKDAGWRESPSRMRLSPSRMRRSPSRRRESPSRRRESPSKRREADMKGRGGVEEAPVRGGGGDGEENRQPGVVLASSMLQAIKEGRITAEVVEGRAGGNKGEKKAVEMVCVCMRVCACKYYAPIEKCT